MFVMNHEGFAYVNVDMGRVRRSIEAKRVLKRATLGGRFKRLFGSYTSSFEVMLQDFDREILKLCWKS